MEVILYKAFAPLITLRGRIFDESTTDVLRRGPLAQNVHLGCPQPPISVTYELRT